MTFRSESPKPVVAFFVFLVASIALAPTCRQIPAAGTMIVVYGLAVFLLSILVPRRYGPLHKTSVDFIYYSGAIIFAAALFIYETPVREKIALVAERQDQRDRINMIKAQISDLETATRPPKSFQLTIRTPLTGNYAAENQEVARVCAEAMVRLIRGLHDRMDDLSDEIERQRRMSECKFRQDWLEFQKWDDSHKTVEFLDIMEMRSWIREHRGDKVIVDGVSVAVLDSKSIASRDHERIVAARQLGLLVQNQASREIRLGEIERQLGKSSPFDMENTVIGAGEFTKSYWPLVLIALLGLKLGREDHLGLLLQRWKSMAA